MTYDLNITFDDNLITGNKTIDTQHKELIERIQNFFIFSWILFVSVSFTSKFSAYSSKGTKTSFPNP